MSVSFSRYNNICTTKLKKKNNPYIITIAIFLLFGSNKSVLTVEGEICNSFSKLFFIKQIQPFTQTSVHKLEILLS